MKTDVTENDVRHLGLQAGLVDNKVCAIDEVWSGLRLVVRVKDRSTASNAAAPKTSRKTAKRSVKAVKPG
jgi:hypothetical protein